MKLHWILLGSILVQGALASAASPLVLSCPDRNGNAQKGTDAADDEAAQPDDREDLLAHWSDRLAAAVDLPTSKARRKAADALAKESPLSLDQWLEVTSEFKPKGLPKGLAIEELRNFGMHEVQVDLSVLGSLEKTTLSYFVPKDYDPEGRWGLMVLLHGAGGHGRSMLIAGQAWAEEMGMLIVAPTEAGENAGYMGKPRERESVLAAIRWMRRSFNVDENRICVAGYSRGGHLTWNLLLRNPDLWAGGMPIAGAPRYAVRHGLNNLRYAGHLGHLPIRQLIGEHESADMRRSVDAAFAELEAIEAEQVELVVKPGAGHEMGSKDWNRADFFRYCERTPRPDRVVRLFARKGEGRAYWVEILDGKKRAVEETWDVRAPRGGSSDPGKDKILQWVIKQAAERTARLEAHWKEPGRVTIKSDKVAKLRVLFDTAMLGPKGQAQVKWNGKTLRTKAKPNARVLLREFVERFDRTFLPVIEVRN